MVVMANFVCMYVRISVVIRFVTQLQVIKYCVNKLILFVLTICRHSDDLGLQLRALALLKGQKASRD